MRISGGTMGGNCATGRPNMETKPRITIRMAMTMATIGRLMKKRYMRSASCVGGLGVCGRGIWGLRRERLPIHHRALLRLLQPFHNDAVARIEPALNDPV